MRILLVSIFFLIIHLTCSGQSIEDLEYDLRVIASGEKFGDKIQSAKKLVSIDFFNFVGTEYICRYFKTNGLDSISTYFEELIKNHPNKAEPLILRSKLIHFEEPTLKMRSSLLREIELLEMAIKIDSVNVEATYLLAEIYYRDFIKPLEENKALEQFICDNDLGLDSLFLGNGTKERQSILVNSGNLALEYLNKLWRLSKEHQNNIYFPIKQLECFLNKNASDIKLDSLDMTFFPDWGFMNLETNWECDFTMDYLFEAESSESTKKWVELQLKDLDEIDIFTKELKSNESIYRFTWLRSFDSPISIRLQNIQNRKRLFYKIGKGLGGYPPEGIKRSRKKRIKEKQWNKFLKLLDNASFYDSPNSEHLLMTDGASWLLEFKKGNKYKVFKTNIPNESFQKACLYLLKMSNIKIKKSNIY